MKPDFSSMTKPELRAYVIAHPKDQEAFYAFVDRFTANASSELYSIPETENDLEELDKLIQQKAEETKS